MQNIVGSNCVSVLSWSPYCGWNLPFRQGKFILHNSTSFPIYSHMYHQQQSQEEVHLRFVSFCSFQLCSCLSHLWGTLDCLVTNVGSDVHGASETSSSVCSCSRWSFSTSFFTSSANFTALSDPPVSGEPDPSLELEAFAYPSLFFLFSLIAHT